MVDRRCRESEGKAKIKGYISVSDEEAHQRHEDIISEMPQNVSAALSKFDLDSRTTIYAVCPACHCIYKPAFKTDSAVRVYPEFCTNHPHPESAECGERLLH